MLIAQHNDDSPNDESLRALCEQQANQGGSKRTGFDLGHQFGFGTILPGLIRSFAETGEDLHLHFDSARRVAEAAVDSSELDRRDGGTVLSSPRGQRR